MSNQVLNRIDKDAYLVSLAQQVAQVSSEDWLTHIRARSSAFLQEQTFPTNKDEEWRFTDLVPLVNVNFVNANFPESLPDISNLIIPESKKTRLVFVNGIYADKLSDLSGINSEVFVGNLANLPEENYQKITELLAQQQGGEEVFTALNTVGFTDVAIVWIPKNVQMENPLHLLFVSVNDGESSINQPRCLIIADKGSNVTIIEEFVSGENTDISSFTNSVTEIWLGENTTVNHTRIQRENQTAFHIGKTAIAQGRYSHYTCNAINLGSSISRHNLDLWQNGESTTTNLNGLTMIKNKQLADTHSLISLKYPHALSRQLYKYIIDDQAHGVFNGKVLVPKPAQLTDAGQLNRNLLLSSRAKIDTKPQLEITADNVKCSHGATVSQLEDDELFYLQSRGLDSDISRQLLINAFATEMLQLIPIESVQNTLSKLIKT